MAAIRSRSVVGRLASIFASLVLASILLYLAVPRTISAILSLPGDAILSRIQNGKPVNAEGLRILINSRERSLHWIRSGRLYTDLGLGQLLLAGHRGVDSPYDQALVADAIESLRIGLALAPARPYAWTRLAYAELIANGTSKKAAKALEMALVTAPYEPRLLLPRLELCLLAWANLSSEAQERTLEQVRIAWKESPDRVVHLARHTGQPNPVRVALLSSLKDLVEFNQRYHSADEERGRYSPGATQ